jgi:hypothetical protein
MALKAAHVAQLLSLRDRLVPGVSGLSPQGFIYQPFTSYFPAIYQPFDSHLTAI